jgi:hypothetical protein
MRIADSNAGEIVVRRCRSDTQGYSRMPVNVVLTLVVANEETAWHVHSRSPLPERAARDTLCGADPSSLSLLGPLGVGLIGGMWLPRILQDMMYILRRQLPSKLVPWYSLCHCRIAL